MSLLLYKLWKFITRCRNESQNYFSGLLNSNTLWLSLQMKQNILKNITFFNGLKLINKQTNPTCISRGGLILSGTKHTPPWNTTVNLLCIQTQKQVQIGKLHAAEYLQSKPEVFYDLISAFFPKCIYLMLGKSFSLPTRSIYAIKDCLKSEVALH